MKTMDQIEDILKSSKLSLFQKYHLKEIGVFGSYLRNEQKNESDLDVLVEYEQTPDFFSFVHLENELSDLIGIKVDLVMKSALKPFIGKRILEEVRYL
ncbi:MAG: DNA polymerase beta [Bacteroidetes bacterium]|nr:MAG: DNA polymerase beta [Bacteroidota bacterium]